MQNTFARETHLLPHPSGSNQERPVDDRLLRLQRMQQLVEELNIALLLQLRVMNTQVEQGGATKSMPPFLVFLTLHWIYRNNTVWVMHGGREQ